LGLAISPFIGGISFQGLESVWIVTIIMILTSAFGNILYFKGMETLDAGTSQIAFSSILIWGTFLSVIFLNSNFSFVQIAGIVLLLLAIFIAQYDNNKIKPSKGIFYIMASAALFAAMQVTSAEMAKTISTGGYLLLSYLGSALIIGTVYASTINSDIKILKHRVPITLKAMTFSSFASFLYFIFSYSAYKVAPDPGVVVVLLSSQVLLAVILGIIFLKERDRAGRKIFAGILAVLAGMLIKG
jgi:drug/metabolite transporter (DMT)-like permease